jgi:uncharacterized protein YneF (UPF0154 family)
VVLLLAWNVIIPVLAFIVGVVIGFIIGVYYLRRQFEKMQNDPQMIQQMAKQMGMNINKQQMQKVQQMMKKHKR